MKKMNAIGPIKRTQMTTDYGEWNRPRDVDARESVRIRRTARAYREWGLGHPDSRAAEPSARDSHRNLPLQKVDPECRPDRWADLPLCRSGTAASAATRCLRVQPPPRHWTRTTGQTGHTCRMNTGGRTRSAKGRCVSSAVGGRYSRVPHLSIPNRTSPHRTNRPPRAGCACAWSGFRECPQGDSNP